MLPSCRPSARAAGPFGMFCTPNGGERTAPPRASGQARRNSGARSIGTLAAQAQARRCTNDQKSHKLFTPHGLCGCSAPRQEDRREAMRIALFQPDIAQNTGTILRLCACLGVEAHIIEPAGFPSSDRAFRRAGMDYLDQVVLVRHISWPAFERWRQDAGARLILFTTQADRKSTRLNSSHLGISYAVFC